MIRTVLIANRGEIARRVARTCRDMGIRTAAVYSDADVYSPFVSEADVAVPIGGPEPASSYLDVAKIVGAAQAVDADAIHPGYGFLSESPALAKACVDAGIIFVGPPVAAIVSMGSKLESKKIMSGVGVPTLPSVEVTDELDVSDAAAEVGYPLLVKASAGGGGKGMRVVTTARALGAALAGAQREAESAFGDGTLFLERYLAEPRHIEVQVFGDTHGTVVAIGERECSIQRRHQKVVEEAPAPTIDDATRSALMESAETAARAVGYVGAGTVEFLVDKDGSIYFLEMNTRLQVEHPVTELVTGLDLVRLQLEVADGGHLHDDLARLHPVGHAVEARLYAEDPRKGYLPSTGTVYRFKPGSGIRVDSGVEEGSEVTIHYDPMLAKLIAHGPTRADAVRTLSAALRATSVHGVVTNRDLLVRILEHDDFAATRAHTSWLEDQDIEEMAAPLAGPGDVEWMALAASIAGQSARRAEAAVQVTIPSGYRNNPSQLNVDAYTHEDRDLSIGYRISGKRVEVAVNGEPRQVATLVDSEGDWVRMVIDGVDRRAMVTGRGDHVYVDTVDASVALRRHPRLPIPTIEVEPGSLLSPMPGKVVRIEAGVGDEVESGAPLVIVEAMKMEHTIAAPHDGVVSAVPVSAGDQVEADQVLAVIDAR